MDEQENADHIQPGHNGNALGNQHQPGQNQLHVDANVPLIQVNGNHLAHNADPAIQQVQVQGGGFDDVFGDMGWMNIDLAQAQDAPQIPVHVEGIPQIQDNGNQNGNQNLQAVQHVQDAGFLNNVHFDWLNVFQMVGNGGIQEVVGGIQENGGWGNIFNVGESDNEEVEEAPLQLELNPEGHEDLEPYWNGDIDEEEHFNVFNMNANMDEQENADHIQPGHNGNALGNQHQAGQNQLHVDANVPLIQVNGNHLAHNADPAIQQVQVQGGGFDDVFGDMGWMNIDLAQDAPQIPVHVEGIPQIQDNGNQNGNQNLQAVQHVQDAGFLNNVHFDWLNIFQMVGNGGIQEAVGGIQENGGWGNIFNVGESDNEEVEEAPLQLELNPEGHEDLEPYWNGDIDEEEHFNVFNMNNPPDEFFDGVDEYIQGMVNAEQDGGEDWAVNGEEDAGED